MLKTETSAPVASHAGATASGSTRSHRAQNTNKGYAKMRDGLQPRSPGSWSWYVRYKDPATGKAKVEYHTTRGTREEAKWARAELTALRARQNLEPSVLTFEDWATYWLINVVPLNAGRKTWQTYECNLRVHLIPAFGSMLLGELQPEQVQRYYAQLLAHGNVKNGLPLKPVTVNGIHRTLRACLRKASKMHKLTGSPLDGVVTPRAARRRGALNVYTADELRLALDQLPDDDCGVAAQLAAQTGIRRGEICALRWRDISFANRRLTVGRSLSELEKPHRHQFRERAKTDSSSRTIAVSPDLIDVLRNHRVRQAGPAPADAPGALRDAGLVVQGSGGEEMCPGALSKWWSGFSKRSLEPLGLHRIRFHDLRHTHATILLAEGVGLKVVSERLGHSSIEITADTYGHLLPGMDEEATTRFDAALARPRERRASDPA